MPNLFAKWGNIKKKNKKEEDKKEKKKEREKGREEGGKKRETTQTLLKSQQQHIANASQADLPRDGDLRHVTLAMSRETISESS